MPRGALSWARLMVSRGTVIWGGGSNPSVVGGHSCIYMHILAIYMHVWNIHAGIYTCIYVHIRAYMHMRSFTYIYIHIHLYTYIYVHIRAYMLEFILGYAPSNRGLGVFWSGGCRHSMAAGCNPVRQISCDRPWD